MEFVYFFLRNGFYFSFNFFNFIGAPNALLNDQIERHHFPVTRNANSLQGKASLDKLQFDAKCQRAFGCNVEIKEYISSL